MAMMQRMPFAFLMAASVPLAASAWLAGCKSLPKPAPPVSVNLVAAADVNPDTKDQASPIVVRLYQLKDDAAFKDADFFALFDKEQATLAAALISREEFELTPGEHRALDLKLSPDARCVGVAAAYRDIRNTEWRGELGTPDSGLGAVLKKNKLTIAVNRASVALSAN
jgi:type VI secretion system protein VasD